MAEGISRRHRLCSNAGQSAVAYLLVLALIALGMAAALSSERMKRSFSILYSDMAGRVMAPGSIDSDAVHAEAVSRWEQ
jgi:hypothetical protein